VSFVDKVRHKALEVRGRIKRNTGEITGDWLLQASRPRAGLRRW
jgi:uncharacterized protein YjbJ (UPF0337 family)